MKRFYKEVSVAPTEGGFAVLLDGRSVKTPARNTLVLPTQKLATAIAAEWRAKAAWRSAESRRFWQTLRMVDERGQELAVEQPAAVPPAQPAAASSNTPPQPREIGGPKGLEPTRYGDWERAGRCIDF